MPLFSDYAAKLRTITLPAPAIAPGDRLEYPVGTIISKTFFYRTDPGGLLLPSSDWRMQQETSPQTLTLTNTKLIETRLMVREASGWQAVSYEWRGNDAYLALAGNLLPLSIAQSNGEPEPFAYHLPSRNECSSCHAVNHSTKQLEPIGAIPAQMEPSAELSKQLPLFDDGVRFANWDPGAPSAAQARSYLDANCRHCHNPKGAADTSALDLSLANAEPRSLGLCKPPIAAGKGTGGFLYGIVPGAAEQSILWHRLQARDLGARMPEIGRSLVHAEGVALVGQWINGLTGECR